MILVTGGTGTVGREVVRGLLARGEKVRVLTRGPVQPGLPFEVAIGDLGVPHTLGPAVAGADRVFMVVASLDQPVHDANLAFAARRACVRHLVKLSAMSAGYVAADPITLTHQDGEAAVRGSGIDWTLLRPRAFMSNTLRWAPEITRGRPVEVALPGLAQACVDPRDVAAVAVEALTVPGHAGRIYRLTGPEALTPVDQLRLLGEVLGRKLPHAVVTMDRARELLLRQLPEDVATAVAEHWQSATDGAKASVFPDVERVTGGPARSFAEWARDHASRFSPAAGVNP